MSEDNTTPTNHENPTPEQVSEFFNEFNPEDETLGEEEISEASGELIVESDTSTDSRDFIKHEELRLKVLEFKLKKKTQLKESHSKFKDKKNERRLRKENAKKAFWFSSIWAVFIAFFILLHGFKVFKIPLLFKTVELEFKISETEFMFVCGTLTASILIFYLTVIKNLFPNKIEEKQSSVNKEN
ncbi:hypothetical protein [Chryseobacterium sp. JV274]|uniref:hypothetical protein n=1 Tax=Chryseobacterium sp. JV274 TaxID=1932669 RepID=UPI0015C2AD14|nr:hypothetical protein [Chryseobacterium sp. JV274]CAD0220438.1 conserved protein of unknown function [Chryseobacterium sp. JV274]